MVISVKIKKENIFSPKDSIYKYNDISGNEKIVTYNELEFNKDNKIFMYSD